MEEFESIMGAWGSGPFENDSALDWVSDLDAQAVRDALRTCAQTPADAYLDVDDGSNARAAAELVGAARAGADIKLPLPCRKWLAAHGAELEDSDAALAVRALTRLLGPNSELASLWGQPADSKWQSDTRTLHARLAQ